MWRTLLIALLAVAGVWLVGIVVLLLLGRRSAAREFASFLPNLALLFRDLATLRVDPSLLDGVDSLRWQGPTEDFGALCRRLDADDLRRRAESLASRR